MESWLRDRKVTFAEHGYGPLQCWQFHCASVELYPRGWWKATAGGDTFAEAHTFEALLIHICVVMNGEPFELRRADPPGPPPEPLQLVE